MTFNNTICYRRHQLPLLPLITPSSAPPSPEKINQGHFILRHSATPLPLLAGMGASILQVYSFHLRFLRLDRFSWNLLLVLLPLSGLLMALPPTLVAGQSSLAPSVPVLPQPTPPTCRQQTGRLDNDLFPRSEGPPSSMHCLSRGAIIT